jgi:hypothetical protein
MAAYLTIATQDEWKQGGCEFVETSISSIANRQSRQSGKNDAVN